MAVGRYCVTWEHACECKRCDMSTDGAVRYGPKIDALVRCAELLSDRDHSHGRAVELDDLDPDVCSCFLFAGSANRPMLLRCLSLSMREAIAESCLVGEV